MKKFLIMFIFSLITISGYSQVFSCDEFNNDLNKFEQIQIKYKSSGNKKWSKQILALFPIANDGTIEYSYVIKSDSIFNIEDLNQIILNWFKIKVPNILPSSGSNHLSCICILNSVGKAFGYMSATFVNAKQEISFDVKENRIKITVKTLQYISANNWNGTLVRSPGSCFPIIADGKQKDSYAMAFINCHYNSIETIKNFIKYLNDNINVIQNGNEDW